MPGRRAALGYMGPKADKRQPATVAVRVTPRGSRDAIEGWQDNSSLSSARVDALVMQRLAVAQLPQALPIVRVDLAYSPLPFKLLEQHRLRTPKFCRRAAKGS